MSDILQWIQIPSDGESWDGLYIAGYPPTFLLDFIELDYYPSNNVVHNDTLTVSSTSQRSVSHSRLTSENPSTSDSHESPFIATHYTAVTNDTVTVTGEGHQLAFSFVRLSSSTVTVQSSMSINMITRRDNCSVTDRHSVEIYVPHRVNILRGFALRRKYAL